MHTAFYRKVAFAFSGFFLILLLAACSSGTPTTTSKTPTSGQGSGTQSLGQTPTSNPGNTVSTTVPMPTTQTSCPPAGTARAAVMEPLALGHHQNIVYLVKEFSGNSTTQTLKRYDLTTKDKTEILKLAGVSITSPQVSADGQWILFVAGVNSQRKLQLVRMDGQGLQTLYCTSNSSLDNLLWSTNENSAVFNSVSNGVGGMYLLNLKSGAIQLELQPADSGPPLHLKYIGTPFTWLDNSRVYVSFTNGPIAPINMLGVLDTSRGPNQQMSDLKTVYQDMTSPTFNYPCWDADSSYDGETLFVNHCSGISAPNCSGSCSLGTREGPSTIYTEPATGGTLKNIFTGQSLGIANVRAISRGTLLLLVENFSQRQTVDTSQNGLWKLKTDGTGLVRLMTEANGTSTSLCEFSQNPWSNVSRDGDWYAFETAKAGAYPTAYTLSFGSLNGGSIESFASIADGTQLAIVGWTTM